MTSGNTARALVERDVTLLQPAAKRGTRSGVATLAARRAAVALGNAAQSAESRRLLRLRLHVWTRRYVTAAAASRDGLANAFPMWPPPLPCCTASPPAGRAPRCEVPHRVALRCVAPRPTPLPGCGCVPLRCPPRCSSAPRPRQASVAIFAPDSARLGTLHREKLFAPNNLGLNEATQLRGISYIYCGISMETKFISRDAECNVPVHFTRLYFPYICSRS